nr:hydroxymethylbilane synthase [uncultured Schaedlerella sp.]
MKYTIGTRGSKLALAQAEYVRDRLAQAYPEEEFEFQIIKTKGDLVLDRPLHEIGDKGVFVKEIEEKIWSGEVQIGVHSMKDMPSHPAPGLLFAKAWKREDPRDALILREKERLEDLPEGAVIGTGSRRREFQIKRLRPDLRVVNIRGNVDTRLRKMEEEKLDGIILAAAGLRRLGMEERITRYLEPEEMIPAPAQGILALEIREGETELLKLLDALSDEETEQAAAAERGFLREIGGDCHVPVGAVCRKGADGLYHLDAMFGNETGSRLAYAAVRGTAPEQLAKEAAVQIRRQMAGTVSLVGGGPGDPGLITVKGLQALREADCIIYDRLSSPELLDEAKPGCELIYAGKADHRHTMEQEEINRLLTEKSMRYENTVRLKGGDVYVFGRGGEEGLFLAEKGVPFQVIPGISSAVGGLACAGIPVTHRGKAPGFHVVTAHSSRDGLAEIDFEAMAKGKETCVFLMGLRKVEEIASRLMEAGMSPDTEAAVISCAATPEQRTCTADLAHIGERVREAGLVSPAVIAVGKVVSLRDRLNFYENRPLFGKRFLIPKIGEKSTELKALLLQQGAAADEVQVGRIVRAERTFSAEEMKQADWLVFTSKNGAEAFFESLAKSRLDIRCLAGCRIAAIGGRTAKVLEGHGLYADLIPDEFHSDALADALKKQISPRDRVWYLKAGNADGHLKAALEGCCRFEEIEVYENQAVKPDLETLRKPEGYDGILFTCASSARRLLEAAGNEWKQCRAFSIGSKTTACLKECGMERTIETEVSTYEGLVGILKKNL